jgi:hypothetical protein
LPIFGVPLALIGLAALPALTAIYWLRTRFRRQEVSSLFLWALVAQAHGGGRRATRLQTPLLWLLELLALLLLALAAAGPYIPRADRLIPVMVVLDDSFSMSATRRDGRSVREAGADAIKQELGGIGSFAARFVIAGPEPSLAGDSITRLNDVDGAISDWRCESASAAIGPAVALAREVGGPDCRVLIVTDRTPREDESATASPQPNDRVRWRTVGNTVPNVGFVNAVRSADPTRDQLLLEITNFSDESKTVTLTILAGVDKDLFRNLPDSHPVGATREIDRRPLELAAFETRRLRIAPSGAGRVLVVKIDDDALMADNRVVLMPPDRDPLPVSVAINDATLSKAVTSAIEATTAAQIGSSQPALTFTDRSLVSSEVSEGIAGGWRVEFEVPPAEGIDAYLGPFVIDYTHPLSAGLSLAGLVWAAPGVSEDDASMGRPVISAGDVPLITERGLAGGARALRIRLRADRSTLLNSAAWPVLIANILDWRRAELPGMSHANARPGLPVRYNLPNTVDAVTVTRYTALEDKPNEPPVRIEVRSGTASLDTDRPGIYRVNAGTETQRYAVNALSTEESDLRGAVTAERGVWNDEQALRTDYRGLAWALGLTALAILALHAWLLSRSYAQPGRETAGGVA